MKLVGFTTFETAILPFVLLYFMFNKLKYKQLYFFPFRASAKSMLKSVGVIKYLRVKHISEGYQDPLHCYCIVYMRRYIIYTSVFV